jgi:hypothetical protein
MNGLIDKDQEHLRLLSIFHYVYGGLLGLSACIPIVYVILGIVIASGAFPTPPDQQAVPLLAGWAFILIGGLFIVVGWTIAGMTLYAGHCLARRQHYTLCFVVACIECLFIPQGTVLGIFTLLVLMRATVKPLFESAESSW